MLESFKSRMTLWNSFLLSIFIRTFPVITCALFDIMNWSLRHWNMFKAIWKPEECGCPCQQHSAIGPYLYCLTALPHWEIATFLFWRWHYFSRWSAPCTATQHAIHNSSDKLKGLKDLRTHELFSCREPQLNSPEDFLCLCEDPLEKKKIYGKSNGTLKSTPIYYKFSVNVYKKE